MVRELKEILLNLPREQKVKPSIQKNPLYDLTKFHIVAEDQSFVLGLLDDAIAAAEKPRGTRVLLFLTKMGDKSPAPVCLEDLVFSTDQIESVSVHPAANIRDKQGSVDLMYGDLAPRALAHVETAACSAVRPECMNEPYLEVWGTQCMNGRWTD